MLNRLCVCVLYLTYSQFWQISSFVQYLPILAVHVMLLIKVEISNPNVYVFLLLRLTSSLRQLVPTEQPPTTEDNSKYFEIGSGEPTSSLVWLPSQPSCIIAGMGNRFIRMFDIRGKMMLCLLLGLEFYHNNI